ncbi:MAG: DUF4445 domain-containing protein [Clostridiales bacterium]|nr:DUF4445 domain-containing protein [Clostridiales bacterium]
MSCTVRFHNQGKSEEHEVLEGSNLYAVMKNLKLPVNAQCGGNGTCGKCLVHLGSKSGEDFTEVLACHTTVYNGMEVYLPKLSQNMKIASKGKRRELELDPIVRKICLQLEKPSLENQLSDLERLEKAYCTAFEESLPPDLLQKLPGILKKESYKITVVTVCGKAIAVESGDTTRSVYGVAFDIGTTSVVGYLIDLKTGVEEEVSFMANPQRIFGADVISRISHTLNDAGKLSEMNRSIIEGINCIIETLAVNNGIRLDDIYAATFAGNTTMMHFLMNIPADGIASAPFIPVSTKLHTLRASSLGICINPTGMAVMLPSVSGYIGADTVAAVLSTGMYQDEKISLLVDIGTNGEIVLGSSKGLYSCSAAAGPAFEGARIRNGVSSVSGAIDKVSILPGFSYTTIGGAAPVGICGSGIVDVTAGLLAAGILDENGTFDPDFVNPYKPDDNNTPADSAASYSGLQARLTLINGQNAFLLATREESSTGDEIVITQRDVRELQNAKAAIAAGIRVLSKKSGIPLEAVEKVYLAGGFGSYMDIGNSLRIGLLPVELEGRIEAVGNAAGIGAIESLLSMEMLKKTLSIKQMVEYIELSSCKDFMDEYVDSMSFM